MSKGINTLQNLNFAIAATSAAVLAFGSYFNQIAVEEKNKLVLGEGSESSFIRSRQRAATLNNAGLGANFGGVIGAGIGGFAGGVFGFGAGAVPAAIAGGAIGSAVGGAAGGAFGFATGDDAAKIEVDRINFQKLQERNDSLFKGIANGTASIKDNRESFKAAIKLYTDKLNATQDTDTRTDIKGALNSSTVAMAAFIDSVKTTSKSMDDLQNSVGKDMLITFASLTNQHFPEYIAKLQKSIDEQTAYARITKDTAKSVKDYEDQINAVTNFSSAFNLASGTLVSSMDRIDAAANQFSVKDRVSPLLDNSSVAFGADFQKSISGFTDEFGTAGIVLGNSVNSAAQALQKLPSILNKLRTTAPFDLESNFVITFTKELQKVQISGPIQDILVAKAQQLIGDDVKDANIFHEIY